MLDLVERACRLLSVALIAGFTLANPALATSSFTTLKPPPPAIGDFKAPERTHAVLTEKCQFTNQGHAKCIVYDDGERLGEYCVDAYGKVFKCP